MMAKISRTAALENKRVHPIITEGNIFYNKQSLIKLIVFSLLFLSSWGRILLTFDIKVLRISPL